MGVILVPVCKIECWGLWYFFFVPPAQNKTVLSFISSTYHSLYPQPFFLCLAYEWGCYGWIKRIKALLKNEGLICVEQLENWMQPENSWSSDSWNLMDQDWRRINSFMTLAQFLFCVLKITWISYCLNN